MPKTLKHARSASENTPARDVGEAVREIINAVRHQGDAAVRELSERFDRWSPASFRLDTEQIEDIVSGVPAQVIDDIRFVQRQVRTFAEHQLESLRAFEVETLPGVKLGQRHIPVCAAAAYVPGGRSGSASTSRPSPTKKSPTRHPERLPGRNMRPRRSRRAVRGPCPLG